MAAKTYTDQIAARQLVNACRRLDRAIASGNVEKSEKARAVVVERMAELLDEFGLPDIAAPVAAATSMFGEEECS